MTLMTVEWFPGDPGGPRELEVLTDLRRLAFERGLGGARPEDTQASTHREGPLMLSVQVPELRVVRGMPELHVGLGFTDDEVQILGGWETFGFALDNEVDCSTWPPGHSRPPSRGQFTSGSKSN